jgi:hypothetical protein
MFLILFCWLGNPQSLTERYKNFPKNRESPQNSRCQRGDIKQPRNIRCHCKIWLPTQDLCCPVLTASGPASSNSLSESWTPATPWMMHIYNSVCYAVQYPVFVDTTKGSPSCLYLSTADDAARVMALASCDNSLIQQLLE